MVNENLEVPYQLGYLLQSTLQAIRSTYCTILQAIPYQPMFGRDMIHNIEFNHIGTLSENEHKAWATSQTE